MLDSGLWEGVELEGQVARISDRSDLLSGSGVEASTGGDFSKKT